MADYWAIASSVVSAAICIRVLLHQREAHSVRHAVGAYLIAMGAGCNALTLVLLVANGNAHSTPYSLILLSVLAFQLFRYRGDTSKLFRASLD